MIGQSGKKATFDFYNGYLTVVYGLLISNGLGYVVKFTNINPSVSWKSFDAFLFLGTFLTSLHFWFVCATVDDLSQDFYRALTGRKAPLSELLVLIDIAVATIFAGLLLAMFDAIPYDQFFLWFLLGSVLSLLYDLYSIGLISLALWLRKEEPERKIIGEYGVRVSSWMKTDFAFVIAAGAMYLVRCWNAFYDSIALGSVLLVFTICLLLMDVWAFRSARQPPFAVAN
jgi:hypothetical protein